MPYIAALLGILVLALLPVNAVAQCFDLGRQQPNALSGVLSFRIFPGAPGFEDVQKGDMPEPGYLLKLDTPICLTGDADFADPGNRFDEVQLVPTEATETAMRALRDQRVDVTLERPMPAMTGHHHRPLVAWVTAIRAETADPTAAYGTPATTVEAFYRALEAGDGRLAAGFVVPEKTVKGPFSQKALTAFYGSLPEPLQVIDVTPTGRAEFAVRYRFRSKTGACDGRAIVKTTKRHGRDFIQSIRAENGC